MKGNNQNNKGKGLEKVTIPKNALEVLAELFGHVVAGVLLFMAVGLATAALNWFVSLLASHGIDGPVLETMKVLEHLLFVGDAVLFTVWVLASGVKAIKELIK